jgi:pyruvate dehydrogenase E1 component alpha subunit
MCRVTPVAPASSCPLREQSRSDIDLLARMLLIRRFDERLIALHQQKLVPGHTSPYVGQEAIAVGVAAELCNGDVRPGTRSRPDLSLPDCSPS